MAVVDDETDTPDAPVDDLTDLQDEEVPLANVPAAPERLWWSWIPVIGAVASAVEGYRKNKAAAKEEAGDSEKKNN